MKLRKTIIAGATAAAIAFSGTGIAVAEETDNDDLFSSSSKDGEIDPAVIKEYLDIILEVINTLNSVMNLKF